MLVLNLSLFRLHYFNVIIDTCVYLLFHFEMADANFNTF